MGIISCCLLRTDLTEREITSIMGQGSLVELLGDVDLILN